MKKARQSKKIKLVLGSNAIVEVTPAQVKKLFIGKKFVDPNQNYKKLGEVVDVMINEKSEAFVVIQLVNKETMQARI